MMRCPRVCLYICRSCLRVYLTKLVPRYGYVRTSMCSGTCMRACTQSCSIEKYIIRHKSGDEVCKTAANFARNRENSDACEGEKSRCLSEVLLSLFFSASLIFLSPLSRFIAHLTYELIDQSLT